MIASHRLFHDGHNDSGSPFVTFGDVVEMIETFTGYEVRGLDRAPGELRLDLGAPIVASAITDGGARFEGRIEHLTLRVGNGLHATPKGGTDD